MGQSKDPPPKKKGGGEEGLHSRSISIHLMRLNQKFLIVILLVDPFGKSACTFYYARLQRWLQKWERRCLEHLFPIAGTQFLNDKKSSFIFLTCVWVQNVTIITNGQKKNANALAHRSSNQVAAITLSSLNENWIGLTVFHENVL